MASARCWISLFLEFTFLWQLYAQVTNDSRIKGPTFSQEPKSLIKFSSSIGAKIECTAQGNPQPSISWRLSDGSSITNISGLRQIFPNGTLFLPPFKVKDYRKDVHTAIYLCAATNFVGTIVSREVEIQAVRMRSFDMFVYDTFVIRGNTAVISCHVRSSITEYLQVISWIRDGTFTIQANSIEKDGKYTVLPSGELLVHQAGPEDAQTLFRCRAKHSLTGENKISVIAGKIIVTEPKGNMPPRILTHETSIRVEEGQNAIISCVPSGHPVPEVKWFTNENGEIKPITDLARYRSIQGALVIEEVQQFDGGKYICESVNAAGTERMETELIVYARLSATIIPAVAVVDVGHTATFNCEVTGYPVKNIQWYKDGEQVLSSDTSLNRNNATFLVRSVSVYDKGMYQCFVKNDFEIVQAAARLKLGDSDSPPELICTFKEETFHPGNNFSLICESTETPTLSFYWTLDDMAIKEVNQREVIEGDNVISWLNVTNARTKDGGVYTCYAKNRNGVTKHSARIHVYGKLESRIRPKLSAISGETVWVNCPVYGYPIGSVTWEKGGVILPARIQQVIFQNGTLRLENVQRVRDSGKYTCVVRNKKGESARGIVDINVRAEPQIEPFSFPELLEGWSVQVLCLVFQGDLPLEIKWFKDGILIPTHSTDMKIRVLDEYSSVLQIVNVSSQHAGQYTCTAKNEVSETNYTATWTVNVPPHWVVKPQDTSALVGNEITIDCSAEGFPSPKIQWLRASGNNSNDQKDLVATNGHIQILSNGSLRISYLTEVDESYYICVASNGVGDPLNKAMYLKIHRPVKFLKKHINQTFNINEDVHLVCEATGDLPINFWWKSNQRKIGLDRNVRFKVRSKKNATKDSAISELFINNAKKNDSNIFTCVAQNAYGTDESNFRIIILDLPDSPIITEAKSQDNGSVKVKWVTPHDGNTPIIKYLLQYKENGDWKEATNLFIPSGKNWTLINNLNPYTHHTIRMSAENKIGFSNFSNELSFKTDKQAPTGPSLDVEIEPVDERSIRITWKPVDRNSCNGVIRGYRIGYKVSGSKSPFKFISIEIAEDYVGDLVYQLTELEMYTQYVIIVQAYNKKDNWPSSPEIQVMTSEYVPKEAPRNVRCRVLSTNTISVIWEPISAKNANGILRGYKVLYKSIDEWDDTSQNSKTTDTPKLILQGLEVNTNYSIEVDAFTKVGDGPRSYAVFCKTHKDVSSAPADIKVLPSSPDSVLVIWKPPIKPNGAVTKYNIYVRPLDEDEEVGSETRYSKDVVSEPDILDDTNIRTSRNDLVYQITGLEKNRSYEFWITAVSRVGESPPSRVVNYQLTGAQTIAAQSAVFDDVIKTPRNKDLTLNCTAVGSPQPVKSWIKGGEPLNLHERVQIGPDGSLVIQKINLEDSGNYTCRIQNKYGTDEVKYAVVVLVPPSAPTLGVYSKSTSSLQLKWQLGSTGGDPLTGYLLYYKKDTDKWEKKELHADQESYVLENLACGATYQIYMEAINTIGVGESSDVIITTTEGDALVPPSLEDLIRTGSTFLSLDLSTWLSTRCSINNFTVEYRKDNAKEWTLVKNGIKPPTRKIVIPGLTPATYYLVRVTAYFNGGSIAENYLIETLTLSGSTRVILEPMD